MSIQQKAKFDLKDLPEAMRRPLLAQVEFNEPEEVEDVERVVHAVYNGVDVVRYEDKWYLEPAKVRTSEGGGYVGSVIEKPTRVKEKTEVTMEEAAEKAAIGVRYDWEPGNRTWPAGSQVFFGVKGGKEFDEIVKSLEPMIFIELARANLEGEHEFWTMRCPGCGEWISISDKQLIGGTCTDHSRSIGGCGFHGYTAGKSAGYVVDLGDKIKEERQLEKEKKEAAKKGTKIAV